MIHDYERLSKGPGDGRGEGRGGGGGGSLASIKPQTKIQPKRKFSSTQSTKKGS